MSDSLSGAPAGEQRPTPFNNPENSEYPVLVRAYLAIEEALAKRILADWNRDNREAGEPDNWPGQQEWDELGQTSHETFWRAARKEAGLPTEGAFKNEVILGSSPDAPREVTTERLEALVKQWYAHADEIGKYGLMGRTLVACADDLRSALSASPEKKP